jgi:hypothetical protein
MGWLDALITGTSTDKGFQDVAYPTAAAVGTPIGVRGLSTVVSYGWDKMTKPKPPPPSAWESFAKSLLGTK